MTYISSIRLRDENGLAFGNKQVGNMQRVVNQEYFTAISDGVVPGHTPLDKKGRTETVSKDTFHTIWDVGGKLPYLTTGEILKISSNDANDDSTGTGARTVILYGQDVNYNFVTETVTLSGTTAVSTVNSFFRLYRMHVDTVGSDISQTNVGDIIVTNNAGTITLSKILAGYGQTQNSFWTVPAGKTLWIISLWSSAMKSKDLEIRFVFRELGKGFRVLRTWTGKDNAFDFQKRMPIRFNEKTDIEIQVVAKEISDGGFIASGFAGWHE